MKKLLAIILTLALLSATAVFAADDVMLINEPAPIYINAEKQAEYVPMEGDMIPLRAICEALGMTVTWDAETEMITIEKLPIYITCTPNSDGYTFAKTAPIMLGQDPVLINGTTYVPATFVTEILDLDIDISEYVISIYEGEKVFLTESEWAEEGQIAVYDFNHGEVILNITDETVIVDEEGNALKVEELNPEMALSVTYDAMMTMSIPPMTNAVKIIQRNEIADTVVEGTICEIVTDENGYAAQVIIGDKEDVYSQTALNVYPTMTFMSLEGEEKGIFDLEVGMTIQALVNSLQTMSIPPQMPAVAIRVIG